MSKYPITKQFDGFSSEGNSLLGMKQLAIRLNSSWVLFSFPIFFLICLFSLKLVFPGYYDRLIREDGLVEYASALAYFLSFLCAVYLSHRFIKTGQLLFGLLYGIFSLGLLFVFLEEISWGQRIFDLQSPEFFSTRNIQGEIGFHNLEGIHYWLHPSYIFVGFLGAFGGYLLPRKIKASYPSTIERLVPSSVLFFYFFPCLFFYLWAEIAAPYTPGYFLDWLRSMVPLDSSLYISSREGSLTLGRFYFWRHQEPVEFLLSLGFLFFLLGNIISLNRNQLESGD